MTSCMRVSGRQTLSCGEMDRIALTRAVLLECAVRCMCRQNRHRPVCKSVDVEGLEVSVTLLGPGARLRPLKSGTLASQPDAWSASNIHAQDGSIDLSQVSSSVFMCVPAQVVQMLITTDISISCVCFTHSEVHILCISIVLHPSSSFIDL